MTKNCDGCGSAGHDVSVCQTKRVLEQAREIAELKLKLEHANGLFGACDLNLNRVKAELRQALVERDEARADLNIRDAQLAAVERDRNWNRDRRQELEQAALAREDGG